MGLEIDPTAPLDCPVPLNILTWREIVRVVLVSSCCKEVNMSESDISATIKGKGYFTTPETGDKKALKLARKRILFNYTIRDETQEALYGEISVDVLSILYVL